MSDAPIDKAPPLTGARFGQDAIWPSCTSAFGHGLTWSSLRDTPSERYDFSGLGQPPSARTPPPNIAKTLNGSQRTPTFSTDSVGNQGSLTHAAQQSSSNGGGSATSWMFPERLQPSTSIPDGEPFPHLPRPLASRGSDQLPSAMATLSSPQSSKPSSRKKDRARDEPQSLEELRDPPSGQKPDYSFPTLIRCAILSHSKRTPTLSEIYLMIHKRFSFFKMDDVGWKNSVRHYLSISPSFIKVPRPITEPGKGNYWVYDANPPNMASRRRKRAKRKPNREDERRARGDEYDSGGRVHELPRPPPLPSNSRDSRSSSENVDVLRSRLPTFGAGDQGIASRHRSPAHGWLDARDSSLGGLPKHRENLAPAHALLADIRRPPHLSSHISGSEAGGTTVVSPYAAGVDRPEWPYALANRNSSGFVRGSTTNGALASPVFPGRHLSQYRPGSLMHSQTLPVLPGLGESFFSSIDTERHQSRHGEEPERDLWHKGEPELPPVLAPLPTALARTDSSSLYRYN